MERNIPGLLLIPLIFFVLPAPPCAATSVVHISDERSWGDAQKYCRKYHSDLVTIRNAQDAKKLASYDGWIGLYRRLNRWVWSRGNENATFFLWDFDPSKYSSVWCVLNNGSRQQWEDERCSNRHPFMCMDEGMILVQEMKTWEEALQHCRGLQAASYNTNRYHLTSLPKVTDILWGSEEILEVDTREVWIGLRFLAGQWLWLNGEKVTRSDLPRCPSQEQHCGVMVPGSTSWKIRDCNEKRNFLCSIL